jgi:DNA-binding XRE family transcriptional regulator
MSSAIKEIRQRADLSQTAAAALARVAPNTWRAFELDVSAVTEKSRQRCERAIETLRALAQQKEAA